MYNVDVGNFCFIFVVFILGIFKIVILKFVFMKGFIMNILYL